MGVFQEFEFFKLQVAWGLGPLRIKTVICKPFYCPQGRIAGTNKQLVIKGHYVDIENRKGQVFLGYGYRNAFQRLNHVKSFLD